MKFYLLSIFVAALLPLSGRAQPASLHPTFPVLDADGTPWIETRKEPSSDRTCGACHDAAFIDRTDTHRRLGHKAPCVTCHLSGSRFPADPAAYDAQGRLRLEAARVSTPTNAHCASCHGVVHTGPEPVSIPDDFETVATGPGGDRTYGLTFGTGEILSSQDVSDSWLNLSDKADRTHPWDVHARRVLACTSCHANRNNPARAGVKDGAVATLIRDPRRVSFSEYLLRPDHELVTADCRSCHDPFRAHQFLPDRKRHMDVLDCRACHVPALSGPAAQVVDATVMTSQGGPAVTYRGLDRGPRESLNAAFGRGYSPFLLHRSDAAGTRLAPFNLITRWYWASEGAEVSYGTVRAAWGVGGRHAPEVVRRFDANRDGILSDNELHLDAEKAAFIRDRLIALGVKDPEIRSEIVPKPVAHGVVDGDRALRDCAACHAADSRMAAPIPLARHAAGGVLPPIPDAPGVTVSGAVEATPEGGVTLRSKTGDTTYVFGLSRDSWSGPVGFAVFLAVVAGVLTHAALRFVHRRRLPPHVAGTRAYLYPLYERLWHWLMALSVLVLLATGFVIHTGGGGFASAVKVHDFFAAVMVANAALSLFYHLATAAIRRFIPPRENLAGEVKAQTRFYLRDIFHGLPHPVPRTAERRLNPLQQITYLVLLNGLFPFQIGTGILIWGASRWPDLAADLGGLSVVGPLHHFGSLLFLSFFVLHVYLTTTGPTLTAHVRSMLDGWGEIEGDKR